MTDSSNVLGVHMSRCNTSYDWSVAKCSALSLSTGLQQSGSCAVRWTGVTILTKAAQAGNWEYTFSGMKGSLGMSPFKLCKLPLTLPVQLRRRDLNSMTPLVRDKWPLYIVTQDFSSRLPIQRDKIVLVTSSFAFARLVCCCLGRSCRSWFDILRVTHYDRCLPVGQQSSEFVSRLDSQWCTPPSVLTEANCELCVKSYRSDPHEEVTWMVRGLNVCVELAGPCPAHQSDPPADFAHEQLRLNVLNEQWPGARSAAARAALQSAKVAWTGPLYFAKAMKDQLPPEILDHIVVFATSFQQLSSAPSYVRQHCPVIRRARKATSNRPEGAKRKQSKRKRGKKRMG